MADEELRMLANADWTIEPHGNAWALYSGRSHELHGARLCNLDDFDASGERVRAAIAAAPELAAEVLRLRAAIRRLDDATRHVDADGDDGRVWGVESQAAADALFAELEKT